MKKFTEFVENIEPGFFEAIKEEKEKGKKLPPWLKKGKTCHHTSVSH